VSANELPVSAGAIFFGLSEAEASFNSVYGFLRAQVSDAAVAEELAARVFLKAYQHRSKLPAGEAAVYWACASRAIR
jgi:DNA-directed RNA polymerase specialized sigma24 family protein